jgi:HSP20 family protein
MEVFDMALIRWSPRTDLWDPFSSLTDIREEMNRLFDTSLRRTGRAGFEGVFAPAIDVVEEKDNFLVRAELPGLTKDDVNVTLQDNYLTIKGEKKHEVETKEANYCHSERVYGSFSRTVELPTSVDAKKIDAHFKDGVLQVKLPKTEEAKPKQIDVKVN